jgi:tRNA U34 5-methylaminomethyl-2-thiouridine-forming methyltransferase MnmC
MISNKILHHQTADGSSTLRSEKYGAHYHSLNGAVTESEHIFINAGFLAVDFKEINILEVGFGTGLNAALTAKVAKEMEINLNYHTLELYPLSDSDYELLNYPQILPEQTASYWSSICKAPWGEEIRVDKHFVLSKINEDFTLWEPNAKYHLVYFDAFAPDDQPEMWTVDQFAKLFNSLYSGGVLVTYSVKGIVKRALKEVGFTLERLAGPPGKKHILRAKRAS